MRDKYEMADGYQIQRQKRINVSVAEAWQAWADETVRGRSLPEGATAQIRSLREDKQLLRLDWPDGTRVLAGAQPKGYWKCDARVQQSRLPDAKSAEKAKAFWAQKLTTLKTLLEA